MATIQERRNADGTTTWRVQIRRRGRPAQTATFDRRTDAREWAIATEAAMIEGRWFPNRESKRRTVADMIDRYVETVLPGRINDERRRATQLMWWRAELGPWLLADVNRALMVDMRDRVRLKEKPDGTRISPGTVNRYLGALSHVFNTACREWGWIESNPMTGLSRPREPRGRVRFLEEDELERLLDACAESSDPNLYPLVELALCTGMRQGELLGLRWRDVDLSRGRAVAEDTKNGERRGVPLVPRAVGLLQDLHARRVERTRYVLPGPRTGEKAVFNYRAWDRAREVAEIEDFRFHDLRHTAASYLAMQGASLLQIAEVLGHKTHVMVKRYAHLSEGHTREVLNGLEETLFAGTPRRR